MIKTLRLLTFVALVTFGFKSLAAISPLSLNLVPPLQFPPDDFSVTGARVSILWGQHRDMYGVDLGVIGNITDQTFTGIGVSGLFNYTKGETKALGLQFAGLTNINTGKTGIYGLQAALGLNLNAGESRLVGVGLAVANLTPFTDVYGLQVGIYNKAREVYGLQIGLVNSATNLHGVQIGLLNFNDKGLFAVAPFLNVGF
ncbi:MAG: hypothetical protein B7Y39_17620 [Bdellovibrio sp. 28-41-41]|nr:MAG: hypothetical protein B7Y39_17620 [Bdellovibrio sp. 28-41-41]